MTRVPSALAVLLLAREAAATNRPHLAVRPATLRQWKHRGHLTAGPGYDLREVIHYVETRSQTRQPVAA